MFFSLISQMLSSHWTSLSSPEVNVQSAAELFSWLVLIMITMCSFLRSLGNGSCTFATKIACDLCGRSIKLGYLGDGNITGGMGRVKVWVHF